MTAGRGTFWSHHDHYDVLPSHLVPAVTKAAAAGPTDRGPSRRAVVRPTRRRRSGDSTNSSVCWSRKLRLISSPPITSAPVCPTAPSRRLSRLLPALSANVRKHGRLLAAHRRQVRISAERPRRLADDEQPVRPRADEHDVGRLDRCVIGCFDLRQTGDRPAAPARAWCRSSRPPSMCSPSGSPPASLPSSPDQALDGHACECPAGVSG